MTRYFIEIIQQLEVHILEILSIPSFTLTSVTILLRVVGIVLKLIVNFEMYFVTVKTAIEIDSAVVPEVVPEADLEVVMVSAKDHSVVEAAEAKVVNYPH